MFEKKIEKINSFVNQNIFDVNVNNLSHHSIFYGKLSLAYYCYHFFKTSQDERYLKKIDEILNSVFQEIAEKKSNLLHKMNLMDGLPGLGFLLAELINDDLIEDNFHETFNTITELIEEKCIELLEEGRFEYFYGSFGLIHYLLLIDKSQVIVQFVDFIYDYGKRNNYYFYNQFEDPYVQGINFGFAHGSLGLIGIALKIYESGIETKKSREIIINSSKGLLKFRNYQPNQDQLTQGNMVDFYSSFPYNIYNENFKGFFDSSHSENIFHFTNRLGWCNGDLSMTFILYKIWRVLGISEYKEIADEIGVKCTRRRNKEEAIARNFYFCHGTSGIAQLFKRISEISDKESYKDAYDFWVKKTYASMEIKRTKRPFIINDLEILSGWLGGSLVLQDYLDGRNSSWDKLFLLS